MFSKIMPISFRNLFFLVLSLAIYTFSIETSFAVGTPDNTPTPDNTFQDTGDEASTLGGGIDLVMTPIFEFLRWIFSGVLFLGAALLDIASDRSFFQLIFGGTIDQSLYFMWGFVRDFCNLIFIIALLFSAFATIFQVSKFHIKNVLLSVIIMALLINFSWPITRVIIDAGNVIMYFFLDAMQVTNATGTATGETTKLSVLIGDASGFSQLFLNNDIATNLGASGALTAFFQTVFIAMLAITFIAFGALLLIRLVMLVLLIVFSPVGFAGAVLPSTRRHSSAWWEALFRWVFMGPILIFGVFLSVAFASTFTKEFAQSQAAEDIINSNAIPGTTKIITPMIPMTAALVVLWSSLAMAGRVGGGVAQAVVSRAQGTQKRFARWTGGRAKALGRGAGRRADYVTGGHVAAAKSELSTRLKNRGARFNQKYSNQVQKRTAESLQTLPSKLLGANVAGRLGGDRHAVANWEKKEVARLEKELKENAAPSELLETAKGENPLAAKVAQKLLVAEKDSINKVSDLTSTFEALGDNVDAVKKAIDTTAHKDAIKDLTKDDFSKMRKHINSMTIKDASGAKLKGDALAKEQAKLVQRLQVRMSNEGNALAIYQARRADGLNAEDAVYDVYGKMNAETFAKQGSTISAMDTTPQLQLALRSGILTTSDYKQEVRKRISPELAAHI